MWTTTTKVRPGSRSRCFLLPSREPLNLRLTSGSKRCTSCFQGFRLKLLLLCCPLLPPPFLRRFFLFPLEGVCRENRFETRAFLAVQMSQYTYSRPLSTAPARSLQRRPPCLPPRLRSPEVGPAGATRTRQCLRRSLHKQEGRVPGRERAREGNRLVERRTEEEQIPRQRMSRNYVGLVPRGVGKWAPTHPQPWLVVSAGYVHLCSCWLATHVRADSSTVFMYTS